MGTSRSNDGPGRGNPLLPPNAPPPPETPFVPIDDEPLNDDDIVDQNNDKKPTSPPADTVDFSTARRNLTKFVNDRSRSNFNRAASSYVKSFGGGKKAASTARAGRRSAARFAGFVSGLARDGLQTTLRNLGVDQYIGQPAEFVLTKLVDIIAPSGATDEEAAARKAMLDSMKFLYDKFDLEENGLEALEAINSQDIETVTSEFVISYIYRKWLQELGKKLEEKSASSDELVRLERQAREFIGKAIKLDFSSQDLRLVDFNTSQGKMIMNEVFEQAYLMIENL